MATIYSYLLVDGATPPNNRLLLDGAARLILAQATAADCDRVDILELDRTASILDLDRQADILKMDRTASILELTTTADILEMDTTAHVRCG